MHAKRTAAAFFLAAAIVMAAGAEGSAKIELKKNIEGIAVGVFLGQPTGFTCRLGIGGPSSIEAKAAWDFARAKDRSAAFSFQANYLYEFPGVLVVEGHDITPYVGGGAQLDLGAESRIGLRVPLGLVYRLREAPFEFCLELGLGMGLFPSTSPMISGGLGARYIIKGKK